MKGGRESISQTIFIMDHKKAVSNKSSDTDLSFHMVKYAIDLICIVCAFMNVIKQIKQKNVIYLIECKRCNMQYFGQTNQQVSKCMNSQRFDINNFDSQSYTSNVALRFNSYPHSIVDFRLLPIDVVKDEMARLCKETYWIHELDTLHPKGMNSKLLYEIK